MLVKIPHCKLHGISKQLPTFPNRVRSGVIPVNVHVSPTKCVQIQNMARRLPQFVSPLPYFISPRYLFVNH